MPFSRPSAIIRLACSMRSRRNVVRLVGCGPDLRPRRGRTSCRRARPAAFLQRHRQRAGGEHAADLAAVDHRFEVVELVDLEAAEDDELRLEAAASSGRRTRSATYLPRATRSIAAGTTTLRRVEAAGREGFVDVDRARASSANSLANLASFGASFGSVGGLGLPEHALDVVLARVFQHEHAPGFGGGDLLCRRRRESSSCVSSSQSAISGTSHCEHFAQPLGDFGERAFRLAADVAEDDLLPAALAAELRACRPSSAGGCRRRRSWRPAWRRRRRGPAPACRWASLRASRGRGSRRDSRPA